MPLAAAAQKRYNPPTAQAYLDAGYSFEDLKIVTGHQSMGSVKHYAHATIETRRALMDRRVVPIRKVEEG